MASDTTTDATKIQIAIRNGLPDVVEALLEQMTCAEVTDCFASTYGLGIDSPDDDGLYQGATPILHAARSGNPDVFSSVMCTMRVKLGPQQVKDLLERKDCGGRSVLTMAARGGSVELFQQALKALEEVYSDGQVETMLTHRDYNGDSLLALAAFSGDKATFESVLTTVQEVLSPEQVE